MVKNGIKTRREAVGIRQAELAAQLRDVTAAAVLSGIESGYAMPTRTDMGILCEVLRCAPEDLYDAEALDLTGRNASSAKPGKRRNNTEIRVRIDPQDKRELTEAVAYLGFRDLSEWLQRMRRDTVRKYRARLEKAAMVAAGEGVASSVRKGAQALKNALNGSGAGNEKAGDDAATSNSRQTNNSKVSIAHPGANVKGGAGMSEYEAMCMLGLDELAQYVPEEAWPLLRNRRRKEDKRKDKQDGSESNYGYLVQTH